LAGALSFALLNLAWEVAQLPHYTIWSTDHWPRIAFVVLHGTAGDLLIGARARCGVYHGRTGLARGSICPEAGGRVATAIGLGYTVFSEWLNVAIRQSWSYVEWMPRVPPFGTGLAPLRQWLVLPWLALPLAVRDVVPTRPASRIAPIPSSGT